ncbi:MULTISPECIES: amidohydrolase family protein [unclassified Falsihalocynthiibacter]|uniref:metal-dependent hydrolase family protein n=1 Tax=unclassified Falsihalocynthiibacter TaxID=2854191 RepID=UPI00350F63A0
MKLNRRKYLGLTAAAFMAALAGPGLAQTATTPPPTVLITNVSIFDGTNEALITGKDLALSGNTVSKLVDTGGDASGYDTVIDGKGGYLTPGLIDTHWHMGMGTTMQEYFGDQAYVAFHSAKEAGEQLMRGVTTVRDAAGNVFGLKKAIDTGVIPGPRLYPSGALISQYSGHGDLRPAVATQLPKEWGGPSGAGESDGNMILANGHDQVLAAARQQLFLGATQIKIAVTGGVSSFTDPLYVMEFTDEEIQAAVKAASDYGTYVMAHGHDSAGVVRALNNGVLSIEHGSVLNEEAVKLIADKGAVFVVSLEVLAQLKPIYTDPVRKEKLQEAMEGTSNVMKWAKKYDVLMGWGTDLLFSAEGRMNELEDLGLRKDFYSSPEIMIQATGNGGKIVAMSGKRNPYGKLGVIEEGAMADVLIYSKNPLEDIAIVGDYENNLKLIMKDGTVYKNDL